MKCSTGAVFSTLAGISNDSVAAAPEIVSLFFDALERSAMINMATLVCCAVFPPAPGSLFLSLLSILPPESSAEKIKDGGYKE
jgi:hypothetical protein